jgi:hypothetical protein
MTTMLLMVVMVGVGGQAREERRPGGLGCGGPVVAAAVLGGTSTRIG